MAPGPARPRDAWTRRGLVSALLAAALAASSAVPAMLRKSAHAAPAAQLTQFEQGLGGRLERAVRRGDGNELIRLGARAGAGALAPLLAPAEAAGSDAEPISRTVQIAAILAAPYAEDGRDLLVPLAAHGLSADRTAAVAAATAAVRIATALRNGSEMLDSAPELDREALGLARAEWLSAADDRERWTDVRVLALETVILLGEVLGLPRELAPEESAAAELEAQAADTDRAGSDERDAGADPDPAPGAATATATAAETRAAASPTASPAALLLAFARDPAPGMRRAAFELMRAPLPAALRLAAGAAAAHDPDPLVAMAAAQALCNGIGFGEDPAPALAVLGEPGMARLRAGVGIDSYPESARIDAARCLAAAPDADNRRALSTLRASLPSELRALVPRPSPAPPSTP